MSNFRCLLLLPLALSSTTFAAERPLHGSLFPRMRPTTTNRCKIAFDWKGPSWVCTIQLHSPTFHACCRSHILADFPHNGVGSTTFLAQTDTIKISMKGLFDFLSMLGFRPRLLNIRIAREVLQQCPLLFLSRLSRLLLSFASC
jgi:hypothetical protein